MFENRSRGVPRMIFGGVNGIGSADASQPLAPNEFAIIGFQKGGSTVTHYFGDTASGSGSVPAAGSDSGTSLLVGTRADFATHLKGSLVELIVYGAALTDMDRGQLVSYLRSKYFGVNGGSSLRVQRSAGNVVLEWTGTQTLEQAATVAGSWSTVTGATSPYTVTPTGAQTFYRLRQ